jgi:hypothetical protein
VIAHPYASFRDSELTESHFSELKSAGLNGIEVELIEITAPKNGLRN